MQCPKCHTDATGYINFCSVCGYNLSKQPNLRQFFKRLAIVTGGLAIAGVIIYGVAVYFSETPSSPQPQYPLLKKSGLHPETSHFKPVERPDSMLKRDMFAHLPHGKIMLRDRRGSTLSEHPAVAVSGGWIALPVKFVYGAYEWEYFSPKHISLPVMGGILQDYDRIGLWRIDETLKVEGPELMPWNPGERIMWIALGSNDNPITYEPAVIQESGNYTQVAIPDDIQDRAGCFFQNNAIVGWTFGKDMKDGFLWTGLKGIDLRPDFRVDDFYRLTFAESREEYFLMALSNPSLDDIELFTLLSEAFYYETKMPVNAIPEKLSVERVAKILTETAGRLIAADQFDEIMEAIDINVLLQARSHDLAVMIANGLVKTEGPEPAFQLVRQLYRLGPSSWFESQRPLLEMYRKLYLNQLMMLAESDIDSDAFALLQEAQELFPDDPAIHLTAVRMYLNAGQWQTAESLLVERSYPVLFNDTVENLSNRIDEMKGYEGKTVIRFAPGSRRIPVSVRLNDQVTQPFVIDTGATATTIPPSTAKAIGIDVDRISSKQNFYTVSGEISAPVTSIDTLSIDQLVVSDLRALVVELPYDSGMGLLGMDFLRHFRMDLNTEEGILILEPR